FFGLFALGASVGAVGTLIGAGGGFILMPVLLVLYPEEIPEILTSISLAVVFANATAGTIAYARMKRVDHRSALVFAAGAAPGAVRGASARQAARRGRWGGVCGALGVRGAPSRSGRRKGPARARPGARRGRGRRGLGGREGPRHAWSFRPGVGIVLSAFV